MDNAGVGNVEGTQQLGQMGRWEVVVSTEGRGLVSSALRPRSEKAVQVSMMKEIKDAAMSQASLDSFISVGRKRQLGLKCFKILFPGSVVFNHSNPYFLRL